MHIVSVCRINYDIYSFLTPITLHFRDNGIFCGIWMMSFSFTARGADNSSIRRILIGRSRLYNSVHQKEFVYHTPFPTEIMFLFANPEDVFVMIPLGGAVYSSQWRISVGDKLFLKLINRNFISNMHCFRNKDVFLQTGTDVVVLCPPGGAVRCFWKQILKTWSWFPICVP